MLYFLYDTIEELDAVDTLVCTGEGIGTNPEDVTTNYADALYLEAGEYAGKYAYLCDSVTSNYVTDREPVEIIFE